MRVFLIVIALLVAFQGTLYAADEDKIAVPTTSVVQQKSDLSLAVIVKLFGNTADFLIGTGKNNVDGEEGFFSGLITSVLGVLNFAAMVYVGAMVAYLWGISAVATAHQGEKLGAGIYNSMWVPIRHALSFGLTIPVIKGFSMMQVIILLCIGISINFANAIWNYSGNFLISHINTQSYYATYTAEKENAYKFLSIIFKSEVVHDILMDKAISDKQERIWEKTYIASEHFVDIPGYTHEMNRRDENGNLRYSVENKDGLAYQEYPIDYNGKVDENGPLLRVDDYLHGRIAIRPRDLAYVRFNFFSALWNPGKARNSGMIQISMPQWTAKGVVKNPYEIAHQNGLYDAKGKYFKVDNADTALRLRNYFIFEGNEDNKEYQRQRAYAEKKVQRLLALWRKMHEAAYVYTRSSNVAVDGSCPISTGGCKYDKSIATSTVPKLISNGITEYVKGITDDTAEEFQNYMRSDANGDDKQKNILQAQLKNALDNVDGKSRFGWMSAGIFPFTLAYVQQSINSTLQSRTVGYNGSISNAKLKLEEEIAKDTKENKGKLNGNYLAGIEKAGDFYESSLQRANLTYSAAYMARTENDKDFFTINDLKDNLISAFSQKKKGMKESFAGILGWTLEEIQSQDPILAIYNFGQRLTNAASSVIFAGVAVSMVLKSWGVILACIGLLITGAFFQYAVPFIPVIYWVKALISWVFMVVESMVAAPFWVCAHALPQGKGFAGDHARRGYMMLLDIIARPVLLVIGAVFAVIFAQLAGIIIYKLFNILFLSIIDKETLPLLPDIIYSVLVMSMVYYIFYIIFTKGVNYMPEHVLQWCGNEGAGGLRDEDKGTQDILKAGGATNQLQTLTKRASPISLPMGGRR